MKNINIEELPEAVSKGILKKKEAALKIWVEIYMNPNYYGLSQFNEDQKSDFLLTMQETFEKLFEKYVPGNISFKSYICGCLSNYKQSFIRNRLTKEAEEKSINTFLKSKIEEDCEKYSSFQNENDSVEKSKLKNFDELTGKMNGKKKRRTKKIMELTALVLLLKACRDIDDKEVSAVSEYTGIDKSLLYEKIEMLKENMTEKEERNESLIKRRNNAYFFHRKYMQEMLASTSTERRLEMLLKKYESQTKKWKEKNEELSVRSYTPSNEEVAKAIGIKPRTVSFYINHAKKREQILKKEEGLEDNSRETGEEE
ncbi:MAG: hypothetical protein K5873_07910 [Treponema sp.]|nr:hypothetical protein [Treponema sp.]